MSELFGFLSVEELAETVVAWRETERRARKILESDEYSSGAQRILPTHLRWILEPVDALDCAAGMRAIRSVLEDGE